jgi:hypothetical protein
MNLVRVFRVPSLLLCFLLITSSTAFSQQSSQKLYFNNGKQITCDQAWQEGDTVFVVPQGKRFAISYEKKEIDFQKSSVRIPENVSSQASTQAITPPEVKPQTGQRSLLTINHGQQRIAREPDRLQTNSKYSSGPNRSNSASTGRNTALQSDSQGSAASVPPKITNPVPKVPSNSGNVAEPKTLQDQQAQQEANRRSQQEYQQKLSEYEKSKRQVEQYNKQVDEHNEAVRKQNAAAQQQQNASKPERKPYLENSYPGMMNQDSGRKPYLNKSYPEMMKGRR